TLQYQRAYDTRTRSSLHLDLQLAIHDVKVGGESRRILALGHTEVCTVLFVKNVVWLDSRKVGGGTTVGVSVSSGEGRVIGTSVCKQQVSSCKESPSHCACMDEHTLL